jgi:BASS family bile acid:Na+ symporter
MLLLLLKTSIATLILAIGMTAVTDDIVYLWRRPVLLVKSIIAMYVVMPAVAVLVARVLDLPERTELALVILAICAGAPLLPKKLIKFGGDPSYVFSLIVNTSLLAIVTVPASLHLFRWPRSVRPYLTCDRLCIETHRPGPADRGQRSRPACA